MISRSGRAVGVQVQQDAMRTRQYVIAFENLTCARHVQFNLHPEPHIRLLRDSRTDVDVTSHLQERIDQELDESTKVVINMNGVVQFPRMQHPGGALHPMNDGGFNLDTVNACDALLMPFQKNIGVILPLDILGDDEDTIVMSCNVIDPADDGIIFRLLHKEFNM